MRKDKRKIKRSGDMQQFKNGKAVTAVVAAMHPHDDDKDQVITNLYSSIDNLKQYIDYLEKRKTHDLSLNDLANFVASSSIIITVGMLGSLLFGCWATMNSTFYYLEFIFLVGMLCLFFYFYVMFSRKINT